ncbi:hypothetical protein [Sandarakinorhabdus sp. DWP1-3-1]|uniref:hypothetical protein n=1 Tax=Sandarakinorhabdus sp. DWP1-3-1 TaxID=2804627 RepID=UPI003CFA3C26
MSAIEMAAQPLLTLMAGGARTHLSTTDIDAVTHWAALKFLILDHVNPADCTVTANERSAFYHTRTVPTGLRIDLMRCGVGDWQTRYQRHSGTLSTGPARPNTGGMNNVCSIALGFGQLFIFMTRIVAVNLQISPNRAKAVCILPKPTHGVSWPPLFPIGIDEAEKIAGTVGDLFTSRWSKHAD